MGLVCWLLQLYVYALFARIILSWFPVVPGGFLAAVNSALYTITEPVLGPLRRTIPPVRLGAVGLDLSPIIAFLGLQILIGFVC